MNEQNGLMPEAIALSRQSKNIKLPKGQRFVDPFRAGVRVFLYMQPPMGMPPDAPFWKRYPEVKGITYPKTFAGPMSTMCTSDPKG